MKIKVVDGSKDITFTFIKMLLKSGLDKNNSFTDELRANDNVAEVVLTVNGREMPFSEVLIDILEQNDKRIEEAAAKRALEIITECGYTEIAAIESYMRQAKWKVKEQIEKLTGIELPDEY